MLFEVYPIRREGRLLPRHAMWSGQVCGSLFVTEEYDAELKRSTRVAVVKASNGEALLPTLVDVVLVSAKPDWWTMTGWERAVDLLGASSRAFVQSWILIPAALPAGDPAPAQTDTPRAS